MTGGYRDADEQRAPGTVTPDQLGALGAAFAQLGITSSTRRRDFITSVLGRGPDVPTIFDDWMTFSEAQAGDLLMALHRRAQREPESETR